MGAALAVATPNQSLAGRGPTLSPTVEGGKSEARIRIKVPRGVRLGVQTWPDRCAVTAKASGAVAWSLSQVRKRPGSPVGEMSLDGEGLVAAIPCGAAVKTRFAKGQYVLTVQPPAAGRAGEGSAASTAMPAPDQRSLEDDVKRAVQTAVAALDAASRDSEGPSVRNVLTEDTGSKSRGRRGTGKPVEKPVEAADGKSPEAAPQPAAAPVAPVAPVAPRTPKPLTEADTRKDGIDKDEVSLSKARALLADGRPEEARESVRKVRGAPLLPDDAAEADVLEQAARLMIGQSSPSDAVRAAAAADRGWLPFELVRLSLAGDRVGAAGMAPAAAAAAQTLPTEAAWRILPYIAEAAYRNGDLMTVSEATRQLASLRPATGGESVLHFVRGLNEAGHGRHDEALAAFQEAGRGTGQWRDKAKVLAVRELAATGKADAKELEARLEDLLATTRGTPPEADVLESLASLRKTAGDHFGAIQAYERLAEVTKGTPGAEPAGRSLQESVDAAYAAAAADPKLAGRLLRVHESYGATGPEDARKRRSDQFAGIISALGLAAAAPKAPEPARAPEPPKAPEAQAAVTAEATVSLPQSGSGASAVREKPRQAAPAKEPKPVEAVAQPQPVPGSLDRARDLWNAGDMAGAAREYGAVADAGTVLEGTDAARWAASALSSGDMAMARRAAAGAPEEIRNAVASMERASHRPESGARARRAVAEKPRAILDSAGELIESHRKMFPPAARE